jgi:hypothetical protein
MPNAISFIKSSLIDKIKIHYANDDAFKLSKESRSIEEIEQFKSYVLRMTIYIIIPKYVYVRLEIIDFILCLIFMIFR